MIISIISELLLNKEIDNINGLNKKEILLIIIELIKKCNCEDNNLVNNEIISNFINNLDFNEIYSVETFKKRIRQWYNDQYKTLITYEIVDPTIPHYLNDPNPPSMVKLSNLDNHCREIYNIIEQFLNQMIRYNNKLITDLETGLNEKIIYEIKLDLFKRCEKFWRIIESQNKTRNQTDMGLLSYYNNP